MKKVLILGGTGAMGVYLVKILSQKKDMEVIVTSRSLRQDFDNVHFVKGNAREDHFISNMLTNNHYDAIVDFMNYNYEEFKARHRMLLSSTDHYIFLSSSRVYDYSPIPLTEDSPRLLDKTTDKVFLSTNRYALRKAREEDMLNNSGLKNYTIIRPYITYSDRRLQLGICEKEDWLWRVLHDKEILFSERVLDKKTTLTFGEDVSQGIARIVVNGHPTGIPVHITTEETMTWGEILELYKTTIKKETGKDIRIYTSQEIQPIEEIYEGGYNTIYDRQWDRCFCNTKAEQICGHIDYKGMKEGLSSCLNSFLIDWKREGDSIFLPLNKDYHSTMDALLTDDHINKKKV